MRKLATGLGTVLASATLIGVALPAPAVAGDGIQIVAPTRTSGPGPTRFAAEAPASTERIAFYVDGRRRCIDRSPGWKCGTDGDVDLTAGEHTLKIRAMKPESEGRTRILTSWRPIYVPQPPAPVESGPEGAPRPHPEPVSPASEEAAQPAPETPPTSEATPAPEAHDPADLLFDGRGIGDYELQEAPGAITEVPDPAGSGEPVLKMSVNDRDVAPITPTENPRAQAVGPSLLRAGDEVWLSTKFMIPSDYPSVPGWLSLVSFYGAPYNGSSPWHIGVDDNELRWQRNGTYNWDIPWKAPLQQEKGKWVTVLLHERFAHDGWVEMWINGEQISFFPEGNFNPLHEAETTRLAMETMDSSNDGGPNSPRIAQYRELGMFSQASLYFGQTRVGTTRSSVGG